MNALNTPLKQEHTAACGSRLVHPPASPRAPPRSAPTLPLPLQIGFFALLLVELVAGQGLLDLLGFTTGNGLGFEL